MPRIGVTGHIKLADGTADLVYAALVETLRGYRGRGLHGVTCLAEGADQLFAKAVTACGGTYEVVLPAKDYRQMTIADDARASFDALLDTAQRVDYMPFADSTPESYFAASEEMLRRVDALVAVWDGVPSPVVSSSANVVRAARDKGLAVTVVWPEGARRG